MTVVISVAIPTVVVLRFAQEIVKCSNTCREIEQRDRAKSTATRIHTTDSVRYRQVGQPASSEEACVLWRLCIVAYHVASFQIVEIRNQMSNLLAVVDIDMYSSTAATSLCVAGFVAVEVDRGLELNLHYTRLVQAGLTQHLPFSICIPRIGIRDHFVYKN